MAAGGQLGFYPFLKKLNKVHPADSESRHPGLEKSIVNNYYRPIYKISRFAEKSYLALRNDFL